MQREILKNSVKGFLIALGTSAVLLTVFGYICYTREDPAALFKPLGVAALFLSAFVGGFTAARFNKSNGLLCGVITGVILMLSVIVISFFLRPDNENIGLVNWLLYVLIAVVSAVGGGLGKPSARKKKKRSRRR